MKSSWSIIDLAWYIYAIQFVSGINVGTTIANLMSGKLNLKSTLTTGLNVTVTNLQKDPANYVIMLGITYLLKNELKKVFGRKKLIELGGIKITL
jgi:uncharacterized membrane-anchored protein YhcB (DUF1043 family)